MTIERDLRARTDDAARAELLQQLEEIESSVNTLKLPLAFADQLYVLREHIALVRSRFLSNA